MRSATTATARGSTVRATVEYIRSMFGEETLADILGAIEPIARESLVAAATTDELPYDTILQLWRAADAALGDRAPAWMEDAGAFAIESLGQKLYGGLLRKSSPAEFLTQSVSLFQLYYAPGDMVPVEVETGQAVLRLIGFPAVGPLFCRRQTGGLRRAAELAGGKDVRIAHVRCEHEGDAYCEWELRWA